MIPRKTSEIAKDVFSYPEKVTIYGISGTYAETYANEKDIKFVHKEVPATEVKLSEEELSLLDGESVNVVLSILPIDFTDEVDWKSSNTDVVTVDASGKITAKNPGTATIKITVGDLSTSCKVTVIQPVTSISLNKGSVSLEALATYQLISRVSPDNAENKAIKWSSSDEKIATVDENGLVKAISKGEATITVEALDGSGIKKNCTVSVMNNGYVAENVSEIESAHPYNNNSTDFWEYEIENAKNLKVTFDEKTEIEDGFDYLYIYDENNNEIGKYTGTELAGKVIEVPGSKIRIQIVSDKGGNAYGFKVVIVEAVDIISPTIKPSDSPDVTPSPKPTDPSQSPKPTVTPGPSESELPKEYTLGDVDANESINATDALTVLEHAAKISVLVDDGLLAADTSKDGNINASDALLILKYAAKIIND